MNNSSKRERLAPPSAGGPKSAFVDISQDALSAGDISEAGLEDTKLTLLQAQMGSSHRPHVGTSLTFQTAAKYHFLRVVLDWHRGLVPSMKMMTEGRVRQLWAQSFPHQASLSASVKWSP